MSSRYYDETRHDSYFSQCFHVIEKLGEGSFGEVELFVIVTTFIEQILQLQVFRVRSKEDGREYAIKRAIQCFRSEADRSAKLSEVQKHEQLPPHTNLVFVLAIVCEWVYLFTSFRSVSYAHGRNVDGCIYKQNCVHAGETRFLIFSFNNLFIFCCSLSDIAERQHPVPEAKLWKYLVDLLLVCCFRNFTHFIISLLSRPSNICTITILCTPILNRKTFSSQPTIFANWAILG
jgi:hypothetical protein